MSASSAGLTQDAAPLEINSLFGHDASGKYHGILNWSSVSTKDTHGLDIVQASMTTEKDIMGGGLFHVWIDPLLSIVCCKEHDES